MLPNAKILMPIVWTVLPVGSGTPVSFDISHVLPVLNNPVAPTKIPEASELKKKK